MFSSQNSQVSNDAVFVEDVFSTYLYTGNGSTQTITNGIDTSTKGGMVWIKSRSLATSNQIQDTVRGASKSLFTNTTGAELTQTQGFSAFGTSGFSLYFDNLSSGSTNNSGSTYASWTFRKQPKFFDVVTYTGNGASYQDVAHSLGSVPGCIMVKCTSTGSTNWMVAHRASALVNANLILNSTSSAATIASETIAYSSVDGSFNGYFRVLNDLGTADPNNYLNVSGATYVAYIFAHNAGGFGLTGTDNVISCGSFTTDGSGNATVSLGYEPQWVLIKSSSNADGWQMVDTMRGMAVSNGLYNGDQVLQSQASSAETSGAFVQPSATGFDITYYGSSRTYIYIAIRRGPMKVPTSGTSVLQTLTYTGNGSSGRIYSGVTTVPDLAIATSRSNTSPKNWCDRLRGENPMISTSTDGESGTSQEGKTIISGSANGTVTFGSYWGDAAVNTNGYTYVNYLLSRAPSFFDEVCFTSSGSYTYSGNHNLTVVPELVILKPRDVGTWRVVGDPLLGNSTNYLALQADWPIYPASGSLYSATSTTISFTAYALGANTPYVAYLFATCAGVSKVGSYTGNGTTQTINCGFTGGARFVLIKRTDSTGDWYVWDTARGIVSANDPHLSLNTTSAEVTTDDTIDTDSTGFIVNQVSATNVNVSSATYIYLAIA